MPTFAVRPSLPGLISSHRLRLLMLIIAGIHRLVNSSIGEWVPLPPRFRGCWLANPGAYPKSVSNCSIVPLFLSEPWTPWSEIGTLPIYEWTPKMDFRHKMGQGLGGSLDKRGDGLSACGRNCAWRHSSTCVLCNQETNLPRRARRLGLSKRGRWRLAKAKPVPSLLRGGTGPSARYRKHDRRLHYLPVLGARSRASRLSSLCFAVFLNTRVMG